MWLLTKCVAKIKHELQSKWLRTHNHVTTHIYRQIIVQAGGQTVKAGEGWDARSLPHCLHLQVELLPHIANRHAQWSQSLLELPSGDSSDVWFDGPCMSGQNLAIVALP